MPRKKTSKIAAPAPKTNRPRYSAASFGKIVTNALGFQSGYMPFGFTMPIPEVYDVNVLQRLTHTDPSDLDAWARFDMTNRIGFTVWAKRRDGRWTVKVNPCAGLGELSPTEAEAYATAFAYAARTARLIDMKLFDKEQPNA